VAYSSKFYDAFVNVSIRMADLQDFDAICDLVVLSKLIGDRSRISNTLDGSSYWVAVIETGSVVGCIGLEHSSRASLLRSAAVHPDYQGAGVGTQLAAAAIQGARSQGDLAIYLFSSDAGTFWQRFGFTPVPMSLLQAAVPDVPQVTSGIERGWIVDEQGWVLYLQPVTTQRVDANDWERWRAIRLEALADSPSAFGSTLADWQGPGDNECRWRERLSIAGALDLLALKNNSAIGMLSAVPDKDDDKTEIEMTRFL
jgi:N-acetylglutamate synthase-like GNAT family acetyltransferase